MLNDDFDTKPTIDESYTTAIGASNLRHDPQRPGAVNIIIAAGINPHRLGLALLRLRTEWDCSAKPSRPTLEQLRAMASTYPRELGGMVLIPSDKKPEPGKEQEMRLVTPMAAAQREANSWYAGELSGLFQRLKSLPMVRDALIHWATEQGIEGAPHVVAAVLLWWLDSRCPVCHGVRLRVVEGTGRTSSKACNECKGEGEAKVPHGFLGRKVVSYMGHCRGSATSHLKDTRQRYRSMKA
jgi:hypothetical protein